MAISHAISVLRRGGSVIHATETCYGIACDLTNPKAVERLFAIKKRPIDQPVSALLSSIDQAKEYLEFSDTAMELARKHLPGPLTIILPMKLNAPNQLFPTPIPSPTQTVGLRLSPNPTAMALVQEFGKPLSTTSANRSGQPEAYSVEELLRQFGESDAKPDLIIDDGILEKRKPSTVVKIANSAIMVIRKGGANILWGSDG